MQATVENLSKMMTYLKIDSFIIHHQGLPLPFEADGENYRPNMIFRLYKNGLMEYRGWGLALPRIHPSSGKLDITIGGIRPTERWLARAYIFLIDDVRNKVVAKTITAKMKNAGKLILKFNGLD